ncbi:hypothetical protein [Methanobrevibacter sp.]|uniref:hypothetical protein n=1 Tax=Methanobrevibacter sp. TaxID=66852 RepID=UPI0026DED9B9|nr:hypothetical protein [Methanobrevibacter sp.]MDO5859812.1 hypothetical protein [Methanobrevibacter sp.]
MNHLLDCNGCFTVPLAKVAAATYFLTFLSFLMTFLPNVFWAISFALIYKHQILPKAPTN